MELLYVYIDHYRTFHQQELFFSKKFEISYNPCSSELHIRRNDSYFNIFPQNIVDITALIGKNSTGKSSILELIGKKIEDRWTSNEILVPSSNTVFDKIDLLKLENNAEYSVQAEDSLDYASEYFLIYYCGNNEQGEDIFVFETNSPNKFSSLFSNSQALYAPDIAYTRKIDYFISKGWAPFVFKVSGRGDDLVYLSYLDGYESRFSLPKITSGSAILTFRRQTKSSSDSVSDSKMAIKRFYQCLEKEDVYSSLNILLNETNSFCSPPHLFDQRKYRVHVFIQDPYLDIDVFSESVFDYRDYNITALSTPEKISLEFMRRFLANICRTLDVHQIATLGDPLLASHVSDCTNLSYVCAESIYFKQVGLSLDALHSRGLILEHQQFEQACCSLKHFLDNAESKNIEYEFDSTGLIITFSPDSDIKYCEPLFTDLIDEPYHYKDGSKRYSFSLFDSLPPFITANFEHLSEGVLANLSLYAAIDYAVQNNFPDQSEYILLFDEIERCMHPELCRNLIQNLLQFLGKYEGKNFQIIIASHSPFIASDLRSQDIIYLQTSKDSENSHILRQSPPSPFGQNIHTILKNQFFLDTTFGAYAVSVIEMILRCLDSNDLIEMRDKLHGFLNHEFHSNDTSIENTEEDAKALMFHLIDNIGETIIRKNLRQAFETWLKQH